MQRSRAAAGVLALALGTALVPAGTAAAAPTVNASVTACPPDVTSDVGFSDVGPGTAFSSSIYCVADLGIASGTRGQRRLQPRHHAPPARQMATFY